MEENNSVVPQNPASINKTSLNLIVVLVLALLLSLVGTVYLGFQNMQLQKQISGLNKTTATAAPSATPDSTANWKTYSNTKYNYSIKYPNNWSYQENANNTAFLGPAPEDYAIGNKNILIQVIPRPQNYLNMPFDQYVKIAGIQEIQGYKSLSTINSITAADGTIGYITTWKVSPIIGSGEIETSPITYFSLPTNKNADLEISLADTTIIDTYKEMLKTFQFTSQTDTSNWKKYENNKYNIVFKYFDQLVQDDQNTVDYGRSLKWTLTDAKNNQFVVWTALTQADAIFGHGVGNSLKLLSTKNIFIGNQAVSLSVWQTDTSNPNYSGQDIYIKYGADFINEPLVVEYSGTQKNIASVDQFSQVLSTFQFTK